MLALRPFLNFILITGLTAWLSACGSNDKSSNVSTDPLGINGDWVSNCYKDTESDFTYTIDKFSFNGNSFSYNYRDYENESCDGVITSSEDISGEISIKNEITTGSGLQATEIDLEFVVQGNEQTVLSIIRVNGNEFLLGENDDSGERHTELDFDVVFSKQ